MGRLSTHYDLGLRRTVIERDGAPYLILGRCGHATRESFLGLCCHCAQADESRGAKLCDICRLRPKKAVP